MVATRWNDWCFSVARYCHQIFSERKSILMYFQLRQEYFFRSTVTMNSQTWAIYAILNSVWIQTKALWVRWREEDWWWWWRRRRWWWWSWIGKEYVTVRLSQFYLFALCFLSGCVYVGSWRSFEDWFGLVARKQSAEKHERNDSNPIQVQSGFMFKACYREFVLGWF